MTREELIKYYDSYFRPSISNFIDGFEYEFVCKMKYSRDNRSVVYTWCKEKVNTKTDSIKEFAWRIKLDKIRAVKQTTEKLRSYLLKGITIKFNTGKVIITIKPLKIGVLHNERTLSDVKVFIDNEKCHMEREARPECFPKEINWEVIRRDYHCLLCKYTTEFHNNPLHPEEYSSTMGSMYVESIVPPAKVLKQIIPSYGEKIKKRLSNKEIDRIVNVTPTEEKHKEIKVRLVNVKSNKIVPVARILSKGKHKGFEALWLTNNSKDRYFIKKGAFSTKKIIDEFLRKEDKSERKNRRRSYNAEKSALNSPTFTKREYKRINQWENTTFNLPTLSKRLQKRLDNILAKNASREKLGIKGYTTREQERHENAKKKRHGTKPYLKYQTIEWDEIQSDDTYLIKLMGIDETNSTPERRIYKWYTVEVPYPKKLVKTGTKVINKEGKEKTVDILEVKPVVRKRKTILVQHFSPTLSKRMHKTRVQYEKMLNEIKKKKEADALKKAKAKHMEEKTG